MSILNDRFKEDRNKIMCLEDDLEEKEREIEKLEEDIVSCQAEIRRLHSVCRELKFNEKNKVVIIIENGIVKEVKASDPNTQVKIIDIDEDYLNICEKQDYYERLHEDKSLNECGYEVEIPGKE